MPRSRKYDELRKHRSLRLTDTAWAWLAQESDRLGQDGPAEVIEQLARGEGRIVWEGDLSPIERMSQAIAALATAWEGVKRGR